MGKEIAHKLQISIPPSVRRIVGKDNDAWENRQIKYLKGTHGTHPASVNDAGTFLIFCAHVGIP